VKLFEHPDFDQVILQATEHFKLRPAIIEKDYYVTEVLRIIAFDPLAFEPPLTKRGIDRELKSLRDAVAAHPALHFVPEGSQTIGGFGRNDRFSYK
jgi:hypothetical protein